MVATFYRSSPLLLPPDWKPTSRLLAFGSSSSSPRGTFDGASTRGLPQRVGLSTEMSCNTEETIEAPEEMHMEKPTLNPQLTILVQRVINGPYPDDDRGWRVDRWKILMVTEIVDAFLLTFRRFMDPKDLFNTWYNRCERLSTLSDEGSKMKLQNACDFLHKWLNSFYCDFGGKKKPWVLEYVTRLRLPKQRQNDLKLIIIKRHQEYIDGQTMMGAIHSPERVLRASGGLGQRLVSVIRKKVSSDSITHSPPRSMVRSATTNGKVHESLSISEMSIMRYRRFTAEGVADSITQRDFQLFRRIHPLDFLYRGGWCKRPKNPEGEEIKQAGPLEEFTKHFSRLGKWVVAMMVVPSTLSAKLQSLEFILDMAKRLLFLGNYNALMVIVSAFSNHLILGMSVLWSEAPPRHRQALDELEKLMSPLSNFKNYQEAFHLRRGPCVPFLGLYHRDFTFMSENKVTLEDGAIDTDLLFMIWKRISLIQSIQALKYEELEVTNEHLMYMNETAIIEDPEELATLLKEQILEPIPAVTETSSPPENIINIFAPSVALKLLVRRTTNIYPRIPDVYQTSSVTPRPLSLSSHTVRYTCVLVCKGTGSGGIFRPVFIEGQATLYLASGEPKSILKRTTRPGSFAKVKIGIHKTTGQKVALKFISRDRDIEAAKLKREVQIHSKLKHPNIARLIEVIQLDGKYQLCLVIEYVEGKELLDFLDAYADRSMSEKEVKIASPIYCLKGIQAVVLFCQIASAVRYLHENGVVHRDIKMENVMVTANGQCKLIDFGLAAQWSSRKALQTSCGSSFYAAPEILKGQAYLGPKTDVWALGVLLYALISGRIPWGGDNTDEQMQNSIQGRWMDIDGVSDTVLSLIDGCLTIDQGDRLGVYDVLEHPWMRAEYIKSEYLKQRSQQRRRASHRRWSGNIISFVKKIVA
ncbi:5'-AMP-activated protein kinase catalytic subunit alpha-1 isoform 2 [Planoprotostelium fungivorum]|uniref:non-specific serine/threonine protein kinase n=1 Tax=Planoprotostelium fungivorum TaxID=1890364 RepID=A0A2P6MWC5_9EUKA|nr:5'-AMP-activated protein kinase catalytic subunit alpha-1 isoform 2 [Planoprotostelium fungivorum]